MKRLAMVFMPCYTTDIYEKDRSVSLRFITQEKTSSEIMDIDATLDQFGILYFRGREK